MRDVWLAWERNPGNEQTAARMVEAVSAVAARLGSDYRVVRARMQVLRRQGMSITEICNLIETKL